MKKTLVVVVLILALCLGVFVGCNNKTCTNHVDANNDGKCDNCGADVTTEVKYSVDITNENSSLYEGKTLQLNVTKEPADAVVNWSTSDATVATVENGVVTALKAGTVTVTATVKEGVSDSVTITVFPYTISIEDVASAEIKAGATLTLTANKQPADAVVSWTSSNNEVATVENGVVTALAKGKTTITASVKDGVSDSIEITVVDPIANAKINTEKFDFSGMYTDAPVIKSNGKQNSFAVLTGDAGKYYVASAVIKVTEPDGGDTWSRVGISHFNGTDSYYGLQLSPGPNFTARKTVTMVIKNDNVQWGTITDRSQVWNQHALGAINFDEVKITAVRNGNDFYAYINDQLYYVDNGVEGFDGDTVPVLNLGSCTAEYSKITAEFGEEAVNNYLKNADKSMFYGSFADTVFGENGSIKFVGAADSTCSTNVKDHGAKSIGTSAVLAANVEGTVEFDITIDAFGGRDAMPAMAITINRYDSACAEARSLVMSQYKAGWTGWNINADLPGGIGSGGEEYKNGETATRLEEGATYHVVFTRLMDNGQDTKMKITDSNGNVLIEHTHGWNDSYTGRVVVSFLSRDLDCTISNIVITSKNA